MSTENENKEGKKTSFVDLLMKPMPNINGETPDDFKNQYTKMALGYQPDAMAENLKSSNLIQKNVLDDYLAGQAGEMLFEPVKDYFGRLIRRAHFPKAKNAKPLSKVSGSAPKSQSAGYEIVNSLGIDKDNQAAQALQEQLANLTEDQIAKLQTPGWVHDKKFVAELPEGFGTAWDAAWKQAKSNKYKLPQSDSMSVMQRYNVTPQKPGDFGPINTAIHESSMPKQNSPEWKDWLYGIQQIDNDKIAKREGRIGDKLVSAIKGTPFLKAIFGDAVKNYEAFDRVKNGGKGAQDNALNAYRLHWNRDYVDEDQLKDYLNAMIEKAGTDGNLSDEEKKSIEEMQKAIKYLGGYQGNLRDWILSENGQNNVKTLRNRFDWTEPEKKQKGIKLFDVKKDN